MNTLSNVKSNETDRTWLKNDDPEIYHLLLALDGDLDALRWLKLRGDGLFLFAEALSGAKEALDLLESQETDKLLPLFDTIAHCDVEEWLRENHAELHGLFGFVRGDDSALKGLKNKKAALKRVADILRTKYQAYRCEDADGAAAEDGAQAEMPEGAAADVGCLIGEMHLQNHDYSKAVEAFSRALVNDPTPDAHAGRARAYRALAALDEHAAVELRARTARS